MRRGRIGHGHDQHNQMKSFSANISEVLSYIGGNIIIIQPSCGRGSTWDYHHIYHHIHTGPLGYSELLIR